MLSETAKTVLTKGENKMEIFESLPLKSETNFMDQGKGFRAFSEFPMQKKPQCLDLKKGHNNIL